MENHLAAEQSPYLRQHAANPVDWFPWGDDAFNKARVENKPIFLSIGYSTCHWCHVMAHESFENSAIASFLNEHFVPIKVDREERPDVDRVYLTFLQAMTGSGGWPMTVWLTPDLKPFFGGTYFPPVARDGRPGLTELLQQIATAWQSERDTMAQSADAATAKLRGLQRPAPTWTPPAADALAATLKQFADIYDSSFGGFGDGAKFPRPSELIFLLRENARTGQDAPAEMALFTLRAIALGGLRDHVGGGFFRYATDRAWRVPHFEKMLYDQAQLVLAFLEAAQLTGDRFYAEVAEDTLLYVLRDMTASEGGFYSAEDADSVPPELAGSDNPRTAEGAFYLWTADEIDALLGDDATIVKLRFGIEAGGNAPHDPQGEFAGKNLLYGAYPIEEIAPRTDRPYADVLDVLTRARVQMFQARLGRPRPARDDKMLAGWNGLMIGAFASVARVLRGISEESRATAAQYLAAATRAATFVRERMWDGHTRTLKRRYREGHAEIDAYADDYAYLIFGLLRLFQADSDPAWLEWAIALQQRQDELFWDETDGGWFSTTGKDPSVLLRVKDDYDGAEPAASSVSALNVLTLSQLVDDSRWPDRVNRTLCAFGKRLEKSGRAMPMMAAALSMYTAGMGQIVIVGAERDAAGQLPELDQYSATAYLPFSVVLRVTPAEQQALAGRMPHVAAMQAKHGGTTAYLCDRSACLEPMTTVPELQRQLRRS
jgi:uncharacterized protein